MAALALLALACLGLIANSSEQRLNSRSTNNKHCDDYLTGKVTTDAVVLDLVKIPAYQRVTFIDNIDNCLRNGTRLVGVLVVACDLSGSPPPSIFSYGSMSHTVQCHSEGPCAAGLTVTVAQFCQPLSS